MAGAAGGALAFTGRKRAASSAGDRKTVFVVPNFHPASCGWLADFSKERVYCANSYLDHLDRVRDDGHYEFVLSEVNNIIAIMNFQPRRIEELRQRIKDGRVELVNGFFLESTINLSGGEALVRLGIEGLRWQQQVFGVHPRFAWTIDVCGTHDQMAQITKGLGLEAMVYTRKNPTGKTLHWAESPDGSRVLALSPGHYSEIGEVFSTQDALSLKQLDELERFFEQKAGLTPEGAPILILAGHGDYALAPRRKEYPGEFLQQWRGAQPQTEIRFTTLGTYLDAILPGIRSGRIQLPTMKGGTAYDFNSFWIECPKVKGWYRRCEHALQAAEMLSTIASLRFGFDYPAPDLYHAWLQMCLNMDRNTLWGAAGGMVFEHEKSWDVRDRFQSVEAIAEKSGQRALRTLLPAGDGVGFFNPLNWKRNDPFVSSLLVGGELKAAASQALPGGRVLLRADLPAAGVVVLGRSSRTVPSFHPAGSPETVETRHFRVRIDTNTGALISLKVKPSGREMLGGPANILVAERPRKQSGDPGDQMVPRPERARLASSSEFLPKVSLVEGPLAIILEAESEFFGGGRCRRTVFFHKDYPRLDFETELEEIPDRTVVVAEFSLAEEITEVRRGIPYGFSHGAWAKPDPELHGWTRGIVPAVRWSHYALAGGGGVAILDRGLTGRELNGRTPILYLLNAIDKYYGYPNSWLSGKNRQRLAYALVAHESEWRQARIPRMAWEYNCPPIPLPGCAPKAAQSFLETSDNVIVESMRREGRDIELRLVECFGYPGNAEVNLALPHREAFLTDLTGANARLLKGGPAYRFPIRPQQIVTLRFRTDTAIAVPEPLLRWDELVPMGKRETLNTYSGVKGHPPRGQ
jgi:alpha-mannosidase